MEIMYGSRHFFGLKLIHTAMFLVFFFLKKAFYPRVNAEVKDVLSELGTTTVVWDGQVPLGGKTLLCLWCPEV